MKYQLLCYFSLCLPLTGQLYEAENQTLDSYNILNSSFSSNGQLATISGTLGSISTIYSGDSALKDISIYYHDESDGDCTYSLLINDIEVDTWLSDADPDGAGITLSNLVRNTSYGVALETGDEVKFSITKGGGEYGRVDYFEISDADPPLQLVVQAEALSLDGFTVYSYDDAEGGQYIQSDITTKATATLNVADTPLGTGGYVMELSHFDLNNGEACYTVYVDGVSVFSWDSNQQLGSENIEAITKTVKKTPILALQADSIIEISIPDNSTEAPTLDALTFSRAFSYEAENASTDYYNTVSGASFASGNSYQELSQTDGSLYFDFQEDYAAYFDIYVYYFDESDGSGQLKLFINNDIIDTKSLVATYGTSLPESNSLFSFVSEKNYLEIGDIIEILGYQDNTENAAIDRIVLVPSSTYEVSSSIQIDTDGSITNLIISNQDLTNTTLSGGAELLAFNGDVLKVVSHDTITERGNITDADDNLLGFTGSTFRYNKYSNHILVKLLDLRGVPKDDPAVTFKLEIPYSGSLSYLAFNENITIEDSGDQLTIYWADLEERASYADGDFALYRSVDTLIDSALEDSIIEQHLGISPYMTWIVNQGAVTLRDMMDDEDQDGLANIIEYVLDLDPSTQDQHISYMLPTNYVFGSNVVISFDRLKESVKDTHQVLQYSMDLENWTDVSLESGVVGVTLASTTDTTENVEIIIDSSEVTTQKFFTRLKVMRK